MKSGIDYCCYAVMTLKSRFKCFSQRKSTPSKVLTFLFAPLFCSVFRRPSVEALPRWMHFLLHFCHCRRATISQSRLFPSWRVWFIASFVQPFFGLQLQCSLAIGVLIPRVSVFLDKSCCWASQALCRWLVPCSIFEGILDPQNLISPQVCVCAKRRMKWHRRKKAILIWWCCSFVQSFSLFVNSALEKW